jgi:hypothetical protein
VSGIVVYDGYFVTAAMDLHVDAARAPTSLLWRVGAVTEHGLCGQTLGWRLDLDDASTASTELAAGEPRALRLRARSRDRPACDPEQLVARCGDAVTLLVMTGADDILAALDTTFDCVSAARTLR